MYHRATAWLRCGRRRIVGISASTIITNNERTGQDAFDRVLIGDRCARRKILGWNGRVNRDRDEKWRMEKRETRFLRAGNVSPIDFVFLAISGQGWGSKL